MMNNVSLLSFTNATIKRFSTTVFTALHFSVKVGEHWAITGGSGSGKTSLLEAIAGHLNMLKGEFEHTLLDAYALKRKGNDPLFSWHHLIEQVSFKHRFTNLSNTNTFYYQQRFNASDSEDTETVEEYLSAIKAPDAVNYWTYRVVIEKFKLASLADKHLIKLSNGETKRLLLAAALIKNPLILLLDNPFTGLDAATRQELNALLSEIAASGITIIMTTASTEIPDVITHIAVMDQQQIVRSVTKKEFDPGQVAFFLPSSALDIIELKALQAMHPQPFYDILVDMKDVVIRYGDKIILDRVNWRINQGERWALVGQNGAGKSTLLSLINGDNPQAYANDILLFDRKRGSGESIWDIKQKIGFVSPELFQYFPTDQLCVQVIESGFYDTLGLLRRSQPENAALVRRWMKLLGVEDAAALPFRNTSTGIQRLCLLIRALVKNPSLLILDEPCQGLDMQQQAYFKQVIDELCRNSIVSIIYVSHYEQEIPQCVKKVLVLELGKGTFH
jgi:molybdate transport system ATP-binding protein